MYIIYHRRDMDGWVSGAICQRKFPDAKLIGWDYVDEIPDLEQFRDEDVIMIDITFPIYELEELSQKCNNLTVIDHHISFKKEFDRTYIDYADAPFTHIYDSSKAACEIGWEYLFPDEEMPLTVLEVGRYDTWRKDEGDWNGTTLPFKYYCYSVCNSPETFPAWFFHVKSGKDLYDFYDCVHHGLSIMKHEDKLNESLAKRNSFEKETYGLKALCINYSPFHSEVLKSIWDPSKFDLMVGFCFTGNKWSVSLRSEGDVDVSAIAKARGGGGHKNSAGFEVSNFEDIFK